MSSVLSRPGLAVVKESDVAFTLMVPGMEGSRGLTHAGFTTLGGGWVRMDGSGELAGWTLKYDEVLYVVRGRLEVEEKDGPTAVAGPGEAILIGEGTTVTYLSDPDRLGFFVLNPRDWDKRP
jgi:ethanolamine utilization protein EutQ (cupin superfamily)